MSDSPASASRSVAVGPERAFLRWIGAQTPIRVPAGPKSLAGSCATLFGWAMSLCALPAPAQVQLWEGEAERRAEAAAALDFKQFPCESPCAGLPEPERSQLRLLIEVRLREGVAALDACTDRHFERSEVSSKSHARYAKRAGILDTLEASAAKLNYKYACDWRAYSGFGGRPGSLEDRMAAANMALIDASMFGADTEPEACRAIQSAELREECALRKMEEQVGEGVYAVVMARVTRGACPVDPQFEILLARGLAEYRVYAPPKVFWSGLLTTPPCRAPGR